MSFAEAFESLLVQAQAHRQRSPTVAAVDTRAGGTARVDVSISSGSRYPNPGRERGRDAKMRD
jgi:hypothetical protein